MFLTKTKTITICFLILTSLLLLSSCSHYEITEQNEYTDFKNKIKDKNPNIYNTLPMLEDTSCIDEIYLYYSDRDLLDTYYTIYLSCVYDEEQYNTEYDRISKMYSEENHIKNSESFGYDSICFYNYFEASSLPLGCIDCSYILFDKTNLQIVYVMIFDKDLSNSNIGNIPKKFLPKEYVEILQ